MYLLPLPLLFLLHACGDASDDTGPGGDPGPSCWTDLAPGETAVVAGGFTEGTEGLAFVDGRLFVTTPTQVVEIQPDGISAPLVTVGAALGLAPVEGGLLLADPGEFSFGGDEDGRIWRVGLDGQVDLVSEGWSNPNFLAPTPWGSVLMSDDTRDGLVDIDLATGEGRTFLETVPSPNGIVLFEDRVVVASTFVEDGAIWQAPVAAGEAGAAELLGTTVAGGANDGLAAGRDGGVWVAVNLAGEIWQMPASGEGSRLVGGLDSPASLALGEGDAWDPCSLYVSSLFGEEVLRVAVGG